MSQDSSQLDDNGLVLPSLTEDKSAGQGESKERSMKGEVSSTEDQGPLRSERRHTLGKDMLAFFILGVVVRIPRLGKSFSRC